MKAVGVVCVTGASIAGCASVSAKAPAERPALNVPAPPPHVIEPAQEPTDPVGELPPATAPSSGASRSPRPTSPKSPASDAKPETKAGDTRPGEATTQESVPPPPPPSASNPQLRTPQTADTSAVKAVQTTLERARNTLATVNYGPLNNELKKAYNDAKQFIRQAEDALKTGNIVFAQAVAAKAETLARQLAGR